jgi:hypothetical protein
MSTVNLLVPSGEGVGASSNVSTLGPERTFVIDGVIAGGEVVVVEGTCDPTGVAGWGPIVASNSSDGGRKTLLHVGAFYRVRRTFAQVSNSPTVSVAADSGAANTFVSMNVPAQPGVTSFGTSTNVSVLGSAFSLSIDGAIAPGEQVILQGSDTGSQWNGIDFYTSPQVGARYYSAAFGFVRIGRAQAGPATIQVFLGVSTGANNAQVVAADWPQFANYMAAALVPAFRNQPVASDCLWLNTAPPGLDWDATANASFPGGSSGGGTIQLSTVFLGANQGFLFVRNEAPVDYVRSLERQPWFLAGRFRGTSGANAKRAISMTVNGNGSSACVGYNAGISAAFLSIWTDVGNADAGVPAITTKTYSQGETFELYAWFDGVSVRLMYGNFDAGVDPVQIGEMQDTSLFGDAGAHPGGWIKSTDGLTQTMEIDNFMGKVAQAA